jgi:hypothetical protein
LITVTAALDTPTRTPEALDFAIGDDGVVYTLSPGNPEGPTVYVDPAHLAELTSAIQSAWSGATVTTRPE